MMSLWDALRMNMMISYQELVRTFLRDLSEIYSVLHLHVNCLIYRQRPAYGQACQVYTWALAIWRP